MTSISPTFLLGHYSFRSIFIELLLKTKRILLECNKIALFLMLDRALPESILEAAPESVTESILRNIVFYICSRAPPSLLSWRTSIPLELGLGAASWLMGPRAPMACDHSNFLLNPTYHLSPT